jgi:coenzyme F420-reducing hydrogenase gamma subunit
VTSAGCNATCPGHGVPCEGCRGFMPGANREEMCRLLVTAGLTEQEIRHRLERFGKVFS